MPNQTKARNSHASGLVVMVILASLYFHLSRRLEHFQELDSTHTYLVLKSFPQMQEGWLVWSTYPPGKSPVERTVRFLTLPFIYRNFTLPFLRTFPFREAGARQRMQANPVRFLERRLAPYRERHWRALLAFSYVGALRWFEPPFWIRSIFTLPFGSTYSPGAGLVYGALMPDPPSFDTFLSRGLIVTQILFHLSAALLFLTAISIGTGLFAAATTTFLYLFSISHYSYAYNLGSTVWNLVTGFLWLFVYCRAFGKCGRHFRNSFLTS